jgi:hypothetical protein
MLIWIIQAIIFSIILIFLVHHLILFFKSTLTVPKIKDLVNTSTQKYESMFNVISNKDNYSSLESKEYNIIDLLPKQEDTSMKSELKNFLKKQLTNINTNTNTNNNTNNNFSTEISAIDTIMGTNAYSDY